MAKPRPSYLLLAALCPALVGAEVVRYPGPADALPSEKFVRVVSEADSPLQPVYIKAKDGLYVAAVLRKPKGEGKRPAIVFFHGAPGGRGMEQITGWSRGATGGPVWERFLKEGFVVAVADYRGGPWNTMNTPSTSGLVTAIDDGLAVIDYVKARPEVDPARVSVYGVSLGGNLALFLASKVPDLHRVVLGAPAPLWFLGLPMPAGGGRPDLDAAKPDPAVASANIAPIKTPILVQVGTEDRLQGLDQTLHDQLAAAGTSVRLEVYEHGYHDFVLGPQGQNRPDLPHGEILLQGALDALERSVAFVKGAAAPAHAAVAAECASLSALRLEDTTITRAEVVAAGTFALPAGTAGPPGFAASFGDLPAFCRVSATLKPSPDSDIKVEVWLPMEGWNRKFQAVGNGGWLGAIIYPALGGAVRRGYAAASTDTGHAGGVMDASFALGHPEKVTDFAWRAVHLMTVRAKEVVKAFYGDPPKLSYWNGCSSGGKQGLKEAQRFPEDFDGIVAGAPANNWTHLTAASVWVGLAVLKDAASYLPPAKYALVHDAALAACDGGDGVKDGVIDDPRQCRFDPAILLCKDADGPNCLTAGQVASVTKIYGPATFSDGRPFFPGLEPGSELGWGFLAAGPEPTAIGSTHYRYLVHADPQWNPRTMDFDKDVPLADQKDQGTIAAVDPDLRPFKTRGGKLILYHGWADALIVPRNSIDYYESVTKALGGLGPTREFARLFMAPGVGHCGGGPGPDSFDTLGALEEWVEKGKAPEVLIASRRVNGAVDRTRPLCAYPRRAKWKGTGSTDDAANFTCVD